MPTTQWLFHSALAAAATLTHARGPAEQQRFQLEQPLDLGPAADSLDEHALFSLHRDLVNIESISGNEHAVGVYLEQYLQSRNYTVERQPVAPRETTTKPRFNLLAYPGPHRHTPLLLSTHIDTVPPFYPYTLHHHTRISGRGAVDAKACIATQLFAAESLLSTDIIPPDSLSFLFVAGEEIGGDGMRTANTLNLHPSTVIFGEPTELKLASGHKGILLFRVSARGRAAHSGYPWLGESANDMLIPALAALSRMPLPSSDKYGNSTLNIGKMNGGVAANVVAESARAEIGIRIAGGTAAAVRALVVETLARVDDRLELAFLTEGYGPVDIDCDVPGFDCMTVNYGTDIANLAGGFKRYLYGPGDIQVAHSDHEALERGDMIAAVGGYKRLIRAALGA